MKNHDKVHFSYFPNSIVHENGDTIWAHPVIENFNMETT
jgi:hypothetical protein